jgi:hypothetical protein
MDHPVIDLTHCYSLQSVYVMLSRVKSLKGVAILRNFPANKVNQCLAQEFQNEFRRLKLVDEKTRLEFTIHVDMVTDQSTFKDH